MQPHSRAHRCRSVSLIEGIHTVRRRCLVHAASTLSPPPRGLVGRLHRTPTQPCWHNVVFTERRPRPSEMSLAMSESVCACIGAVRAARAHRFCIDPVASYRAPAFAADVWQRPPTATAGHDDLATSRTACVSKMYSYTYRTKYRRAETRGEAVLARYTSPRIEGRPKRYILNHPRLHHARARARVYAGVLWLLRRDSRCAGVGKAV